MPRRAAANPTSEATPGLSLIDTYVQLLDGGRAMPVEVDAAFWDDIENRAHLHAGRLVGMFHIGVGGGDHLEMHPAGDELLVLVSGEIDVVLGQGSQARVVRLRAGQTCVVPRGTWHQVVGREPGAMIFITPGEGTQHRPRSED